MKKLIFCVTVLAFGLSSCSLYEKPEAYASKADIFQSEDGIQSYAYSFYRALPTIKSIPTCEASTVDYAACRTYSNFYSDNAYTAETSTSWSWSQLRNINYFLDALHSENCTVKDEVRNHFEGVARWFRAWFYYDKLTTYGPVPWFDHCLSNTDIDEMYKSRDSRDVIIGHINPEQSAAAAQAVAEAHLFRAWAMPLSSPSIIRVSPGLMSYCLRTSRGITICPLSPTFTTPKMYFPSFS